ncbi:major facilitator superfamily domain-containing protein [Pseudomassariella vexata]|uniref:Major facilitator superfamily domain-containing protein n=1 Tax=Pseudomassariella vexata TaxID=1141098 RepID=A0A1Y2DX87_9PEZI|nr:major facilitator superfamily domain-containing protein [Pseudomassariella vexata]ORY63857.1 major facilitator superfamily domain-containing protein [Pseudomassariella vexata]
MSNLDLSRDADEPRPKVYHIGWRLHALTTGQTTIVNTSLVSIVNALDGFNQSGWVSIACGLSNSMLLLYNRVPGLPGNGWVRHLAVSTIVVPLMVPPQKYATYIAIITSVFAFSSVLGLLLGGAITDATTCDGGPGGALAAILVAFSIPFSFPYGESTRFFRSMISERAWKRIDFLGAFMSLAASILLSWNSGAIVAVFVISARQLSTWNVVCEPIFPWRLARNRFVLVLLFNGVLTGFPFMAAIINIPQRLQTVNSMTAIGAGIRLLPLLLSPVASAVSGLLMTRLKVLPLYLLIIGGCLQAIDVVLFSSLDSTNLEIQSAQYGYQVLMGFGFGFSLSTILMMAPLVVQQKDMAVGMGSVTQIRILGGTIGFAICSALLNNHIKAEASGFLTVEQVAALLESFQVVKLLPSEVQLEA